MTRAKLFMGVAALVAAGPGGCGGEKDETKPYNQAFASALTVRAAVPLGSTAKLTQTVTNESKRVNGKLVSWKITYTCSGDTAADVKACRGSGEDAPGGGKCTDTPDGATCTWSGP